MGTYDEGWDEDDDYDDEWDEEYEGLSDEEVESEDEH